jgi:LDH2 family malate/lactate/ureidoglycolate dehydrogenase
MVLGILLERRRKVWHKPASITKNSSDVVKSGSNHVYVNRQELERCVAACLEQAGAPPDHSVLVARVLVAADCRGIPSHGVNRAEMYCQELQAGLIHTIGYDGTGDDGDDNNSSDPTIVRETDSIANINGHNNLGAVVAQYAMEIGIQKAKATGVSLVVCHNSNHFGIAGYWAQLALDQGLIGLAMTNTSPFMVPTRAKSRAAGTNPIACYCPAAGNNDSFQLDMATTTVPVGKIEVCHRQNQAIPLGWGVTASGTQSTTDPTKVMSSGGLTPLGGLEETAGYKGYGLNMMVEILCAVLSGCQQVGPDVPPWRADRGVPVGYGHCFLCIDPHQFLPNNEDGSSSFPQQLAHYLDRMRNLPPAEERLAVLVPGDPERQEEAWAAQQGVRLHVNVAQSLRTLVRDLGCNEEMLLPPEIRNLPETNHVAPHPFASLATDASTTAK